MGKLLWTPKNRKISHIFIGMDINSIVCYRGYDNRAGLILVKEKNRFATAGVQTLPI